MRPYTRALTAEILDVVPAPEGRIAVATADGVELFEADLSPCDVVPADLAELFGAPEAPVAEAGYALGDGHVLHPSGAAMWTWRRPDGSETALAHDFAPTGARELPGALAVREHDVLYVWRPGADGPPLAASAPAAVGTTIVVDGTLATVRAAGRHAWRGEAVDGSVVRVPLTTRWRAPLARDVARALIGRLVKRPVGAPAPDVAILDELAFATGGSRWNLFGAFRARRYPLLPPLELPGYAYLGAFSAAGPLLICDPRHLGGRQSKTTGLRAVGRAGEWYAYARVVGELVEELVVCHRDGLEVAATDKLGEIAVESGAAGVFDSRAPAWEPEPRHAPRILANVGALAPPARGPGSYHVLVASVRGAVVKLRLPFADDGAHDRSVASSTASSRAYSPRERFEVGDTLEHPKFGVGTVIRVAGDAKIEVVFADARRVLAHAKA